MILGTTVKILARQVPNYHLVSPSLARHSLTLCACRSCRWSKDGSEGHLLCDRVAGRVEDDGYAIVATNGTCDRAEWRKDEAEDLELTTK